MVRQQSISQKLIIGYTKRSKKGFHPVSWLYSIKYVVIQCYQKLNRTLDQTGNFSTRESGQVEPAFQTCNSIVETVANNIFKNVRTAPCR